MPFRKRDYHPKWSLIKYLIIVVRAKNRCEKCGAENRKPHPLTGYTVYLATAHINQDRRINRFWNLAALCQRCHLVHDRKAHAYSRRYGKETKYSNGKLFELPPVTADK